MEEVKFKKLCKRYKTLNQDLKELCEFRSILNYAFLRGLKELDLESAIDLSPVRESNASKIYEMQSKLSILGLEIYQLVKTFAKTT